MTHEEIQQREAKENASFLNWIKSPSFQLQSHEGRTTDLEIYMIAKNREIGDLQAMNAAQAKRIAELEDQLSSFPIPTAVAMQKIGKLRSEGFKEYAATVLNKENQYCIVGDYGDVRWSSKNGESNGAG